MTGEAVVRVQARGRMGVERAWRALNELGTALAQCSAPGMYWPTLDRHLPQLCVAQAFVASYLEPSLPEGPRRAELRYRLDPSLPLSAAERAPYPAHELLPARLWGEVPSLNWVVLPLFFRDREQGFALLDLRHDDGSFYEAVRILLSLALDGFDPI